LHWPRLTIAFTVLLCGLKLAAQAAAAEKRGQVIAEFEISPDGDFLRVPVTIGGRDYPFLVSTGQVTTTIDEALRSKFELYKLRIEFRGKRASQMRERYGGLGARLGNLPLNFPDGVEAADYSAMREKLDLECQGEIGMDFLGGHIVQLDFDQGKLRFLASLPPAPGDGFRITLLGGEGGVPTVPVTLAGTPPEKFMVATARAGYSLEIRSELLAQLAEHETVKIFDKEKGVTRSGGLLYQMGRLESAQVGKFRHEGLLVNSAEQNTISVGYLSRYLVTFDFPRNKMYLKKGANFDAADVRYNLWEVGIERDDGLPVLREVHAYGPARRLGLRAGDVVETINGCDARQISNWQVRRFFGREGRPLSVVVRRGSESLTLETDPPAAAAADDDEK
jgi:hypothetical protein